MLWCKPSENNIANNVSKVATEKYKQSCLCRQYFTFVDLNI